MYLNTRIFPTTGYARVLLFMFIRRELGGTGTGCLFQFTYCESVRSREDICFLFESHFTNLSTKYLVMCKVYTDVGGIK